MNYRFDVAYVREHLEQILDDLIAAGEHVGITRDGEVIAVIVPYAWFVAVTGTLPDSGNRKDVE